MRFKHVEGPRSEEGFDTERNGARIGQLGPGGSEAKDVPPTLGIRSRVAEKRSDLIGEFSPVGRNENHQVGQEGGTRPSEFSVRIDWDLLSENSISQVKLPKPDLALVTEPYPCPLKHFQRTLIGDVHNSLIKAMCREEARVIR